MAKFQLKFFPFFVWENHSSPQTLGVAFEASFSFRRLVARTIAQQINPAVGRATAPFQCALTTRAGVECVAHVIQTLTDLDHTATVLSVDGVGAFD